MESTPEMEMSKIVQGILSDSQYTKQAKKMFDKYDLNIDDQKLAHALSVSQVSVAWNYILLSSLSEIGCWQTTSPNKYVKDFKNNIIGKTVADMSIAYPEYAHFKEVSKHTSKVWKLLCFLACY